MNAGAGGPRSSWRRRPANLARVEDVLGELRPQARRLAAQAEQQATRARAGEELAAALVARLGTRWHVASNEHRHAERELADARHAAAIALDALQLAEKGAADAVRDLSSRADAERAARDAHEAARVALAVIQLDAARASAEAAGITRDRDRLAAERAAAEAELAARRRELALPMPEPEPALDDEIAEVERALTEARSEGRALRTETAARSEAEAALRRAGLARVAETDGLKRRLADAERRLAEERTAAEEAARRAAELETAAAAARAVAHAAREAEMAARAARDAAQLQAATTEAERRAAAEAAAAAGSRAATLRGRLEALLAQLAEDETRGIGRAARRIGGRALAAGLEVDPALRVGVSGAIGELARAFVVRRERVDALMGERGLVVIDDIAGPGARPPAASETAAVRALAVGFGGGLLVDAVRVDPAAVASRLLARWAWVPALADALEVAGRLPAGWSVATRGGCGRERIRRGRPRDRGCAAGASRGGGRRPTRPRRGRGGARGVRGPAGPAPPQRPMLPDQPVRRRDARKGKRPRIVARPTMTNAGPLAMWSRRRVKRAGMHRAPWQWQPSVTAWQTARPFAALERSAASTADVAPTSTVGGGALAAWDARAADLQARLDRLVADRSGREARRRAAEDRRARADAAATGAEERIARAEAEAAALARREEALAAQRGARELELAEATVREGTARAALDGCLAADIADRERLRRAELSVGGARESLRRADEIVRAATVRELEARLGIDAVREQALVELAGLGDVGVEALEAVAAGAPGGTGPAAPAGLQGMEPDDDDGARLAAALARAGERWAAHAPGDEGPPAGRLAGLRRRFHELGAPNPFAAEEYATARARLEELEAQRRDLDRAIERTRGLIAELDTLIATQFRATFRALEAAFDRRFGQLFGGGFARLSLTDPTDLAATGVEIVARPPGKKAQSLSMLSGGERALTAVALLFAMLEVRPVPFCVLDEVDAALDEANVGRFVEALRGLAATTQFVVITHNRGTIEAADALFGVTVGDDAVSRVISLRLDEATAIAEHVTGGGPSARTTTAPAAAG